MEEYITKAQAKAAIKKRLGTMDLFASRFYDLTEKPRFTKEEVEYAKAAKVLWPHAVIVKKETGAVMLYGADGAAIAEIDADMFPSIRTGQSVKLPDIVGGTV